ncbi:MAG: RNA methyltransferase [Bacteroidales bacterium]|nr:RNA methyltransferase [Bacteroidales bacterium]
MISATKIKYIKALKDRKFRSECRQFIAEGPKVVIDLLVNRFEIVELYATPSFIEKNEDVLSMWHINTIPISPKELDRMSHLSAPNEVLAICSMPTYSIDYNLIFNQWSFVLDGVNDPGNLGTIIRIAHWLNIKYLFCSNDTVDVFNNKTIQSTMGSIAHVKVVYIDLVDFLKTALPKISVFGTYMNGQTLYETSFENNGIVVFGNETHGISDKLSQLIQHRITIPRIHNNIGPDSLNVAVSAAIFGSELLRRKLLA